MDDETQTTVPDTGFRARMGGELIGLGLLSVALASSKSRKGILSAATAVVAGVTVFDLISSRRSRTDESKASAPSIRVAHVIAIDRTPDALYAYWRKLDNLPRFMRYIESIKEEGEEGRDLPSDRERSRVSHWVARGPGHARLEWDAEIVDDRPGELIAWRAVESSPLIHSGSVRFEPTPGGRGTLVRVEMDYWGTSGNAAAGVAKLTGHDPSWQLKDALRRFKQLMEVGEIVTTEGQPAGRRSSTSWRYDTAIRN